MAWVKIPPEHHDLFRDALPKDARVETVRMFGGLGGLVNGNMFGGLFARSAIVRLSPADVKKALALEGATMFDPMGNGRLMKDTVMLPESVLHDASQLRGWLVRALDATAKLPPKKQKQSPASTTSTSASATKRASANATRPRRR